MQVFNTFLKITKKKIPSIITYIVIFFSVSVLMMSINTQGKPKYETVSLKIHVIDEDNTTASRNVISFLDASNEVTDKELSEDEIKNAIFYRDIDYVLTIKSGYEENLKAGKTNDLFESMSLPSTFNATYISNSLNQYVRLVNMYGISGYSFDEASAKATEVCSQKAEVTVEDFGADTGNGSFTYNYFRMIPYILIMVFVTGITIVIITIRKKEMRERIICAPISSTSYTLQIILGASVICVTTWLLFVIASIFLGGPENFFCLEGGLMVLNSFVFMLVSISLSVLVCSFISSKSAEFAVTMIANVVGLGMSFLCGVFVPQYLLGESVTTIARFLPAYWYVNSLDSIVAFNGAEFSYNTIFGSMGIQLLFAAAMFAISLVVSKAKKTA